MESESILEKGLQILSGALPTPPVLLLIGIVPRALEQGRAVFELAVDTRHHNPMGSSLPDPPESNALMKGEGSEEESEERLGWVRCRGLLRVAG